MDGRKTLLDQCDRSVLGLVQVERADEATRLVRVVDLDLHVALHVSAGCELERLLTVRVARFRRVTRCTRRADAAEDECENLVILGKEDSEDDSVDEYAA